jgi:hypothetical protein
MHICLIFDWESVPQIGDILTRGGLIILLFMRQLPRYSFTCRPSLRVRRKEGREIPQILTLLCRRQREGAIAKHRAGESSPCEIIEWIPAKQNILIN